MHPIDVYLVRSSLISIKSEPRTSDKLAVRIEDASARAIFAESGGYVNFALTKALQHRSGFCDLIFEPLVAGQYLRWRRWAMTDQSYNFESAGC